jgi:hypothetical protein
MKKTVLAIIILAAVDLLVSLLVKVGAIPFHVFGTWPHTILAYAVFLLMLAIALGIYDGMEKKP